MWLRVHVACQLCGVAMLFVSVILPGTHSGTSPVCGAHCGMGGFVTALVLAQAFAAWKRPTAHLPITRIRWVRVFLHILRVCCCPHSCDFVFTQLWEAAHKTTGYCVFVFGTAAVFTGFDALLPVLGVRFTPLSL